MNKRPDFDALVENAFDFLREAIAEFRDKPKYSIIHFCAAVELILKARLLREHWTLVLRQPEKADLVKFKTGDFLSISVKEAVLRLDNILGEKLSDAESKCFTALATHRNRMIHFYHSWDAGELEKIAAEECLAWFYLHRLMHERWKEHFAKHATTILELVTAMTGHKEFLAAKFAAIKEKIAHLEDEEYSILQCPACSYIAMKATDRIGDLSMMECLVCGLHQSLLVIHCPDCQENVCFHLDYYDVGVAICPKCGKKFAADDLCDLLDEDGPEDPMNPKERPRCPECEETKVVSYHGKWVCASCLRVYDDVANCGYCNALHAGLDMDDSFVCGCPECEGKAGVSAARDD